jgi:hypothetical protein
VAVIEFGEFLPDRAPLGNPGVLRAENVFPSASGYVPVKALAVLTNALTAKALGAINVVDPDKLVFQFAGDAAKLYQNADNSWVDRSKLAGYATGSGERWEFAQWKNKVLATNFSDSPQQITLGALAFSDLTTAFKARHIAVVRDFVVVANTSDATDGAVPHRVRWSALDNETLWTVDPSTLSDFQDLKIDSNERVFGGEFGVILQRKNIWRMTFVGAPVVFQFDRVAPDIGVIAPGAAAQLGDRVYFLSDQGFFVLVNGTNAQEIGTEKVDRFVLGDLDKNHLASMSAVSDPASHRVFFAYAGSGNTDGRPNRIVVYDTALNRFALIALDVEILWSAGSIGFTMEGLDTQTTNLDSLEVSLDSDVWKGGARKLGVFDSLHRFAVFDATNNLPAVIETAEAELHSGRRTALNGFRPLVDGGTVTAEVGSRNRQVDTVTFSPILTQRPSGRFTPRVNAQYHRFRLNLSGDWQKAMGVQIDPENARASEARG